MLLDSALLHQFILQHATPAECQLIGADSDDNVGGDVGGNVSRSVGSCFEGFCIPFFKSFWHNIHTRLKGRAGRPAAWRLDR
jgi:hypothetical protein